MKKRIVLIIVIVAALALVAFVAVKGKEYYQNRYVGTDYYAVVPQSESIELVTLYDDSGREMGKGREYALTAVNEQGEQRVAEFSVHTDDAAKLLQPGEYLKISMSKTIVVKHQVINKAEVPETVLDKLD